jgi:hypothetical protein
MHIKQFEYRFSCGRPRPCRIVILCECASECEINPFCQPQLGLVDFCSRRLSNRYSRQFKALEIRCAFDTVKKPVSPRQKKSCTDWLLSSLSGGGRRAEAAENRAAPTLGNCQAKERLVTKERLSPIRLSRMWSFAPTSKPNILK